MQSLLSSTLRRSTSIVSGLWVRPNAVVAATTQPQQLGSTTTTSTSIRGKHSQRQVKRLFKNHPARQRVHGRLGMLPKVEDPPEPTLEPIIPSPEILSNGWTPPPNVPVPEYPFRVARTSNKPKDAVGFLPVYSKMRYVESCSTTKGDWKRRNTQEETHNI